MIRIKLNDLEKLNDYRIYKTNNYQVVFSTAEADRSFNRWTSDGIRNLESIKEDFNVSEVVFIKQIHSDISHWYKEDVSNFIDLEGDAIISNNKNIATGVFTADCVPIILIIKSIGVMAAIHSGWRGTYDSIILKTLQNISSDRKFDISDVEVLIGPHIKQCCYEVSDELKDRFLYKKKHLSNLFNGRNLNLQEYIIDDLIEVGVKEENIIVIDNCTYCCTNTKLHSYRKAEGAYGRLFTFVIKK